MYVEKTLPSIVKHAKENFTNDIAIKEGDFCLSYDQLIELSYKAAKSFIAMGLQKGERVAIWAPNIHEWIVGAIGLQCAGGVLVPLNTRMKGSEAAYILNRSEARFLLTVESFALSAQQSIEYPKLLSDQDLPQLEQIILMQGDVDGLQCWHPFLNTGDGISDDVLNERMNSISADDTMDMLFTSGTTGQPKGVLCGHGQNIRTFDVWSNTVGLRRNDNYLIINPFFHSFGYKAGWLSALLHGAKILPVKVFNLDDVLQQIEDDQISMLPGPPTIYQSILAHPDYHQKDLSSLRLAVTGAASVPVALIEKMRNELKFEVVVTAYGLTETCGVVSICRPEDSSELIANTSGRAMDGVEIKCVDANGENVPVGEQGEIWVRGFNVMQGYFKNDEATKNTLTNDGWLRTGDVGILDENGYVKITDRLKDMYISGGFNVYPAEVENALAALEGVAQAAVIGVPDERMGEVGKAFIVKLDKAELTDEQVITYCREHLSNYKVPRQIAFVDALPTNASGKILKRELS